MRIDWNDLRIDDECKTKATRFEKLALDFVNDKEKPPQGCWEQTGASWDGNKDGRVVIFGFKQSGFSNVEWWMEAKYSTPSSTTHIARYRLDPTVVSALENGHVRRIVFVTNIKVHPRIVSRIQRVLKNTSECEYAPFYTGRDLEAWIVEDYARYSKFFANASRASFDELSQPRLDMEPAILSIRHAKSIPGEDVDTLYSGENYCIDVNVISDQPRKVRFALKGDSVLRFCNTTTNKLQKTITYKVDKGSSQIELHIRALCQDENALEELDISLSDAGPRHDRAYARKRHYHAGSSLGIVNQSRQIDIASQTRILEECQDVWRKKKTGNGVTIVSVSGESGTGKSFVIDKLLSIDLALGSAASRFTFVNNPESNALTVADIILNYFLPFVPPEDMDSEYLKRINLGNGQIASSLVRLKEAKTIDELIAITSEKGFLDALLPKTAQSRMRVLVIDDYHKLQPEFQGFLAAFFSRLCESGRALFAIVVGQNRDAWQGRDLISPKIAIYNYDCTISYTDLLKLFKNPILKRLGRVSSESLFGSVIELALFVEYVKNVEALETLEDFRIAYHAFRNSDYLDTYVRTRFKDTVFECPNAPEYAASLVSFIYYCPEPLHYDMFDEYREELNFLTLAGLVKRDFGGRVIPFHDIYRDCFLRSFKLFTKDGFNAAELSPYSKTIMDLSSDDGETIESCVSELNELFLKQRFHSLLQLLSPIFCDSERDRSLRRVASDECYGTLKWLYAYSNANVGQKVTGLDGYLSAQSAIGSDTHSVPLTALHYLVTFEVFNSSFEHMEFATADNQWEMLKTDSARLSSERGYPYEGLVHQRKIPVESVRIMLDGERGDDVWERINELHKKLLSEGSFDLYRFEVLRMAMTQLPFHNADSLEMIRTCAQFPKRHEIENPKSGLMCCFVDRFVGFVVERRGSLHDLENAHLALQADFENDFNRHLPAMAALYISLGDLNRAAGCLLEYRKNERRRSKRQDAICQVAEAALLNANGQIEERDGGEASTLSQEVELIDKATDTFSYSESYLMTLKHNRALCESGTRARKLAFYYGQPLELDVFYFDLRFIY